jgi:hypothetical protein
MSKDGFIDRLTNIITRTLVQKFRASTDRDLDDEERKVIAVRINDENYEIDIRRVYEPWEVALDSIGDMLQSLEELEDGRADNGEALNFVESTREFLTSVKEQCEERHVVTKKQEASLKRTEIAIENWF